MAFDFSGKTVGVTGAAGIQGIGFAIAKKFLESGAKVFLCDLKEQELEKAREQLAPLGEVKAYVMDVSRADSVEKVFERAEQELGSIDVFVNNAGIYPQSMLCDMGEELWETVMNVNLKSVFLCSRECKKYMQEKGGVIINAASFASLLGSDRKSVV